MSGTIGWEMDARASYVNPAVCCGPCGKKAGNGSMPSYMYLSDGRAVCYQCGDEAIRRAYPASATPPAAGGAK